MAGDSEQDLSETKYGLRRVRRAIFRENPSRYVLRVGFPDFPFCPWGGNFSRLGWDRELEEYVWLDTKILKEEGLLVEEYGTT